MTRKSLRFVLFLVPAAGVWLISGDVAAQPSEADAKLFELLDTSGNGYLSGNEATEVIAYDADGDKRVTKEEFFAGRSGKKTSGKGSAEAPQVSVSDIAVPGSESDSPAQVPQAAETPAPATERPEFTRTEAPTSQPAARGSAFQVGDAVEAFDGSKWYKAKILKAEGGKYFIDYEGWSDSWNEWLPPDRVRAVGSGQRAKSQQPGGEGGASASPGTGKYKVGQTVEAHDKRKWYKAQVLRVEDGKYFVHYDGWSSTWDEWVTDDRIRPAGSGAVGEAPGTDVDGKNSTSREGSRLTAPDAPAKPVPGEHGLEGLFLQVKTSYGMNGSLSFNQEHYYFSKDGRVLEGVPSEGLDDFDFEKECAKNPKKCGYYGIDANEITFSWPGRTETLEFARKGEDLEIDGLLANKVGEMTPGQQLEGHYSRGATSSYQGSFISSARSITFHKDGTFESGSIGGVSFGSGSGAGGSAKSESSSRGTYKVGRNTLELRHSDGKVTKHTIYPFDLGNGRTDLSIDGGMMKKEK